MSMIRILASGLWLGLAAAAHAAALRPVRAGLAPQPVAGRAALAPVSSPSVDIVPVLTPISVSALRPASRALPVPASAAAVAAPEPPRAWAALQAVSQPGADGEAAAGRLAAAVDGTDAPADAADAAAGAVSVEQLRALQAGGVPVLARWRDRDSGRLRDALCRISGVSDVRDLSAGRWRSWDVVYVDVAPFRIYVEDLRSVSPAGMTTREYFARIRPQAPAPLDLQLARAGLSAAQVAAIRARSRGVLTAPEFLRSAQAGSLSLGVTDNLDQYAAMVRTTGLVHWKVMYRRLMGDIRSPRPAEFMDRLLGLGRPVYMFLPPGQVTEEDYPNTYAELAWLLAHPDRMRDVQFVSGAYDMLSREDRDRLFHLRGAGLRRQVLGDMFQRISGGER